MPSGRTSMLELPANVLLATHPACSERRHRQPSRRSHERKLGDQTKDDADKEPREERSCGRSNVVVQCLAHASLLGEGCAVLARRRTGWADSLPPNSRRAAPPICPDLIVDRHRRAGWWWSFTLQSCRTIRRSNASYFQPGSRTRSEQPT